MEDVNTNPRNVIDTTSGKRMSVGIEGLCLA